MVEKERVLGAHGGYGSKVVLQRELDEITECCICSDKYDDPRILSCVHTFCLRCLQASLLPTGGKLHREMPCPLCRKPFTVPRKGLSGLKKNFFMSRLIELTKTSGGSGINDQDDKWSDEAAAPKASDRCTEDLHDNKIHLSERIQVAAATGNDLNADIVLTNPVLLNQCRQHDGEQMRLYCIDCDDVVCVLCFIAGHQSHKCNDVDKAAGQFRQQLQKFVKVLEDNENDETTKTESIVDEQKRFLNDASNIERLISGRSQQLKDLIDKHEARLLEELTSIRRRRLKEFDNELDELSNHRAHLNSFKKRCSEFKLKRSSIDVCREFRNLQTKVDDLQKLHVPLIERKMSLLRPSFTVTDAMNFLPTDVSNVLGEVKETTFDKVCIVVGSCDEMNEITNQVTLISLEPEADPQSPEDICHRHMPLPSLPTPCMQPEAAAIANEDDSFYVVGVGEEQDEIWRYGYGSGWTGCHRLVQGRARHCVTFVGSTLFICGGSVDDSVISSVEGYDTLTNICARAGDLLKGVECAASVCYRGLIYVFGGAMDDGDSTPAVQEYNVVNNSCAILARPMPRAQSLMRATIWKSFAILIGPCDSYLYDFEYETWHERTKFKTDLVHFGLILEDDRIFLIGGGVDQRDAAGDAIWKCTSEVRTLPLRAFVKDVPLNWRVQAQLPRSELSLVNACVCHRLPSDWN